MEEISLQSITKNMPKSVSKPGLSVTVTQALIHRKTLSLPHTLPWFFYQNRWLLLSCFVINWFPLFVCVLSHLVVSDSSVTPWTVAHQAPLSTGFPRQENWSGLSFSSPGDFPDPGTKPMSPALTGRFFSTEPPEKPLFWI